MEPPPKRPRLEEDQYEFVFQSITPRSGRTLYRSKRIQLIAQNLAKEVVCDGSPPHGSWEMTDNELIIIFHHKGVVDNMKRCVFRLIENTESWLQVECPSEWQSVLIPPSTGSFKPM